MKCPKSILWLTAILSGISLLSPAVPVNASDSWKSAYAEILNNTSYKGFSLCYVDDDDIPELVLHPKCGEDAHNMTDIQVYTYYDEKAVDLGKHSFDGYNAFAYHERENKIIDAWMREGLFSGERYYLYHGVLTHQNSFTLNYDDPNGTGTLDGMETPFEQAEVAIDYLVEYDTLSYDYGDYAVTQENIAKYLTPSSNPEPETKPGKSSLTGNQLANMTCGDIAVEIMGREFSVEPASIDGFWYFYNNDVFPGVIFGVESKSADESAVRWDIEHNSCIFVCVRSNWQGNADSFQITDAVNSSFDYRQCAKVLGSFGCRTTGIWTSGGGGMTGYDYSDWFWTRLYFDLPESDAGYSPEQMNSLNPKISGFEIRLDLVDMPQQETFPPAQETTAPTPTEELTTTLPATEEVPTTAKETTLPSPESESKSENITDTAPVTSPAETISSVTETTPPKSRKLNPLPIAGGVGGAGLVVIIIILIKRKP